MTAKNNSQANIITSSIPKITKNHYKKRTNDELVTKELDSLLTTSSGYTNYRGVLNLVIILLLLSNARAALENIIKYGILVDPLQWIFFLVEGSKHWPALIICCFLMAHSLISFLLERLIAYQWLTNSTDIPKKSPISLKPARFIHMLAIATLVLNLIACLTVPPIILFCCKTHPISASFSLMLVSIVFLKLVSYHMMNFWCRDLRKAPIHRARITNSFLSCYIPPRLKFTQIKIQESNSNNEKTISSSTGDNNNDNQSREQVVSATIDVMSRYPDNLILDDFVMYLFFPTLCYELEFPRSTRIRKRFLVKRVIEVILLSQLDMALIQQWIVPTVNNSLISFRQMQLTHMLERLLKLAIPNHIIWVIWFYLFFHSLLNIQAELTRYADREFYRDWWNSESVQYFWSHWNIPVHKWCARHLYLPLIALGLTKCQAGTAVFFVSAFFHEYLVSVPLKMFRIWAFTGMLIQLPLSRFVSAYFNNNWANIAVWLSIILGQPLCILMYYHDYYIQGGE